MIGKGSLWHFLVPSPMLVGESSDKTFSFEDSPQSRGAGQFSLVDESDLPGLIPGFMWSMLPLAYPGKDVGRTQRYNLGFDMCGYAQPPVMYAQPIVIDRVPMDRPPINLRVPPEPAKHWSRHCREYNACGERVFFVEDGWYNREYAPRYME